VPYPCPRGTFSSSTLLTVDTQCITCSVGSYCQLAALTAPTGSCSAGYFCSTKHNVARPVEEECPAGYECSVGSTDKTICSSGYQDQLRQSSCKTCPAGFKCPLDTGIRTKKVMCDASADSNLSFYCPDSNTDTVSCNAGFYSTSMLSSSPSDCQTCPSGFYCLNSAGEDKFKSCPAGYVCGPGSATATGTAECLSGFYCPVGFGAMVPCTPGKY
jgi:hypothetical protein